MRLLFPRLWRAGGRFSTLLYVLIGLSALLLILAIIQFISIKRLKEQSLQNLKNILAYQTDDYEFYSSSFNVINNNISLLLHQIDNIKQEDFNTRAEQRDILNNQYRTTEDNLRQMLSIVDSIRQENKQSIDSIRNTVDSRLAESLDKKLSESFALISERLEGVYKSIGEMQALGSGIDELRRTLSNVKTRGTWGEIQLGIILEQALTGNQYESNVQVVPGSSERVEYAVILPSKSEKIYLPIDSKFPQESYKRLLAAYDEQGDVTREQKAFATAIKTEAKRISDKYIKPPYTTDFAIMFLPLESLYAEVVKNTSLVEELQQKYRVMPSGPSTMMTMLNSLQLGFKSIVIEQRSDEIKRSLVLIRDDFANFSKILEQTRQRIQQAGDSIDSAFSKSRNIHKHLSNIDMDNDWHIEE